MGTADGISPSATRMLPSSVPGVVGFIPAMITLGSSYTAVFETFEKMELMGRKCVACLVSCSMDIKGIRYVIKT
jgi:hypothetical protein